MATATCCHVENRYGWTVSWWKLNETSPTGACKGGSQRVDVVMSSKAWFKPSSLPQLVARFASRKSNKSIEVWTTTCIVTNFGMRRRTQEGGGASADASDQRPRCSTLINPANPSLSGPHAFPYFPKGGPQPDAMPQKDAHHIMGYVSQWGGMDVGGGMLFSAATIDGLVHTLGGLRLRAECSLVSTHPQSQIYVNQQTMKSTSTNNDSYNRSSKRENTTTNSEVKCPVGFAVSTTPGGEELRSEYDCIIHTVPPFYNYPPTMTSELKQRLDVDADVIDDNEWARDLLVSCYRQSFRLAFANCTLQEKEQQSIIQNVLSAIGLGKPSFQPENRRIAVPLLGAGCRGFPTDVALDVAAKESVFWLSTIDDHEHNEEDEVLAFGLLETADAEALATSISDSLGSTE